MGLYLRDRVLQDVALEQLTVFMLIFTSLGTFHQINTVNIGLFEQVEHLQNFKLLLLLFLRLFEQSPFLEAIDDAPLHAVTQGVYYMILSRSIRARGV